MMKPIEFVIEETPTTEQVNDKGEYVFGIYTSNACDEELEQTLETMVDLWKMESMTAEVTLTINVRLRSLFENLYEMYNADGKIDAEDKHLFDALRKDCQWIVDHINDLKVAL
jgi:hypothetical protein